MPRANNEDRAKVKLRVIEFELEGGNASVENSIRQLTHALALRNGLPASSSKAPKEIAGGTAPPATDEATEVLDETEYADAPEDEAEKPSKPTRTRPSYKPKTPKYVHDLDLVGSGTTTFKAFAEAKNPKKGSERYLVAAFWLKEFGSSPTANIDKVYTCYRTVDWPTNQSDWDGHFRTQVKIDRFRRVNPGEYAITPKGEDVVRELDGTR